MLDSFVQSVTKLIIRQRADYRIAAVKKLLAKKGFGGASASGSSGSGVNMLDDAPDQFRVSPSTVRPWSFPVYSSEPILTRVPVNVSPLPSFAQVLPMTYKVPLEYKLMGYTEHSYHVVPGYIPLMPPTPLRQGAPDEKSVRAPHPTTTASSDAKTDNDNTSTTTGGVAPVGGTRSVDGTNVGTISSTMRHDPSVPKFLADILPQNETEPSHTFRPIPMYLLPLHLISNCHHLFIHYYVLV
jgi:hypothetical protein